MRTTLLSLSLLLVACEDHPNRQELVNTNISLLDTREWLARVQSQVGTMQAVNVQPLADRVAALEAENATLKGQVAALSTARKVPHLVSRDTGVDYGISIDGALAAWDDRFAAVIDYSKSRVVSFAGADCSTGPLFDPNLDVNAKFNRYLFMPDGRLARLSSTTKVNAVNGSTLEADGTCANSPNVYGYPAVLAAFSTPRAAPESLDIALR